MRQAFRDPGHAALARADALAEENQRLRADLAAARAALALQHDVARALSPQRAFVRAMILAATVVAGALLAAFELVSRR